MENPQAQMQQGQPQQGGQDQQMQQIMQMVQQMIQQGVQPVEAAAELLGQQVPPEIIMQVFVQMGMPEQDAQMAIEQAMQGGQQPQGQGEEQMEGVASNPQEEMAEQGAPAPEQGGQPSPAEEIQMRYGGRMPRRLRSYAEGGDTQEMEVVMQQVQDMMAKGADPRQVMEQIQAAAQQGQISPEVATQILEQLSGMQQATDPQGSDVAMTNGSQDPQAMDPNMAAPESQMMKFGGNLKKLMSRAYGGPAVAPAIDSKNYAKDRATMFVNAVKNNTFKSALEDDFPSLGGNQMAYGGNLPKAVDGISMKDNKLVINPSAYKSEADYKAAIYDWNTNPANKNNQVTSELFTANKWKEPEFKAESGKQYELDATTGKLKVVTPKNQFQFAEGDIMGQDAQGMYVTRKDGSMMRIPSNQMQSAQTYYSQINPVAYQNPYGTGLFGNLAASASPFGRMIANFGTNNMYDPRITGTNLPGGMSGQQFLGAIGANGLVPGMAGNVAGQNWRIGQGEEFKEGSIWKGNRRKGVRYQIDWGDAAAINGQGTPGTNPQLTGPGPQNWNNVDDDENTIPDYLEVKNSEQPIVPTSNNSVYVNENEITKKDTDRWDKKVYRSLSPDVKALDNALAVEAKWDKNYYAGPDENNPYEPITLDRKDFRSDRSYYKAVYPKLSPDEIKEAAKNFSFGELPNWGSDDETQPDYDSRKEMQAARKKDRQENQDNRLTRKEKKDIISSKKDLFSKKPFEYGGNVDPIALENAIALINRAFGGDIPKAFNGLNLTSSDDVPVLDQTGNQLIGSGSNMMMGSNNVPAFQDKSDSGTIEQSIGKKMNIDWRGVAGAAGDMYMNNATKLTSFMNDVNAFNPERENARYSALDRPSNTYDTMKQGTYDQAGNFIPNDIGNEVLNPTNSNFNNQRQIFAYGGKVYEIGGEVDLEDDELEQLAAAGFKLSRV